MARIDDWINRVEGEVTLSGADPSEVMELELPGGLSKTYKFLQVRVAREANTGTGYTASSLNLKMQDKDPGGTPDNVSVFFVRENKEPDSNGVVLVETEVTFGSVIFGSRDNTGKIYVTFSRAGGAGDSSETYKAIIDALRNN